MKNILVIGGSGGIGQAIVGTMSENGDRVYATYNSRAKSSSDNLVSYHYMNVLDKEPDFSYLPENIHGLVYTPGSINLRPFNRLSSDDFRNDLELQLIGFIKCFQALLPRLKSAEACSVVLFSSVAAHTGLNYHSVVSTSKAAIEGLSKALAAEFAPKIRVNCIAPSLTRTTLADHLINTEQKLESNANRHPMKRIGEARDIAELTAFLLSEKSSWITGQIINVDGGYSTLRV